MNNASDVNASLQRHAWATATAAIILVFGLGGWAALVEFSGAVIANGQLVVETNAKKVQHPTGGVVGELYVRDGSFVHGGDVLAKLDDTQTRANLSILTKALDELEARRSREQAERDGAPSITYPQNLLSRVSNPDVNAAVAGEERQFQVRQQTRNGQRSQLRERSAQLREEIEGYMSQVRSKAKQVEWISKELDGVNKLWLTNLVPYTRVTSLEREKERIDGERGQLLASIAQSRGKIAEIEIQILQIDQDMRTEVEKDLADIRGKVAELIEKKVAAEDLLKRIDIRAPQSGYVHQLTVHTVGGVIAPGEQIMLVIPSTDALTIEAKVQPQDIDQIYRGQKVVVRFSSFSQRTTPELNGTVAQISADTSEDQKTGVRFYTLRVALPDTEVKRLGEVKLIPGMPIEVFAQTSSRTVLSFLTKAISDQVVLAFREK